MPNTTNPVVIATLKQCVTDFNAQAKEYFETKDRDLSDLAMLCVEDGKYNQKCLISYMKSGDYDQLINSLVYQDTLPRERVIYAMMEAGCYPEGWKQSSLQPVHNALYYMQVSNNANYSKSGASLCQN